MKLSEAIRLGATMKPQAFYGLASVDGLRTCAMGAAYDAVGMLQITESGEAKIQIPVGFKRWEIMDMQAKCPACGCLFAVVNAVMHLNDSPNHRWTREMIADWVELEEVRLMAPDEIPDPIPTPSEAPVEVA
jgi:hypothetical protein